MNRLKPILYLYLLSFVLALPLAWLTIQYSSIQTFSLQTQAITQPSIIYSAPESASEEIAAPQHIIAAKIDLQRKLIVPQSANEAEQIRSIVESQGGQVVSTGNTSMVLQIPKEIESGTLDQISEQNLASEVEVDYPVYLSGNPDWGVIRIDAPGVWETTGGQGISVAIIDTGIDYHHPDLQARYIGGFDTYNNNDDPYDDHGHGTHVAGIVASSINNQGLIGTAPNVNLLAIKALGADGTGYLSDVIEAIDWSVNNGAQIINLSLGTTYNSNLLRQKVDWAAGQGIVLVAAAGNTNGGSLLYPAAYDSVIAVSATNSNDQFASFSSIGAELAAPGVAITSTVPGGGYATWSGTSMAAPHVAGTVALMLANNQDNVRQLLRDSAIDLGEPGVDPLFGHGLVHAKPAALGIDTLAPIVTFLEPEHQSSVSDNVWIRLDIQDESDIISANLSLDNQELVAWQQPPYEYLWVTSDYEPGEYDFVATAEDEYNNLGMAYLSLTLADYLSPSPTASPSPTLTPTPTSQPNDFPDLLPTQGLSESVRQDNLQQPAIDNRRDKQNIPPVTNNNRRNPRPNPLKETSQTSSPESTDELEPRDPELSPSEARNQSRRPQVRGAADQVPWIVTLINQIFGW